MFQVLVNFFVGIKQEQRLYADVDRQIGIEPNSRLYYTRAYLNENQAKYDAAIADYRKAVEMDEFNYDANFNLGLSLMKYESRKSACLEIGDTAGAEKYTSLIKGME